ncbi:hypothetical protein FKK32_29350, partial [Klebsiella pneumoniae]|nr:hypothetical protein [Klebsiella pneumoniae]
MQALKDRSIATRMRLGFALLIVMSMAVAGFGRVALQQVGAEMHELTEKHMVIVSLLTNLKDNVNVTAREARNIALLTDPAAKKREKDRIDANRSSTQELLKQLQVQLEDQSGSELLERVTRTREAYVKVINPAIKLGMEGNNEAARDLLVGDVTQA